MEEDENDAEVGDNCRKVAGTGSPLVNIDVDNGEIINDDSVMEITCQATIGRQGNEDDSPDREGGCLVQTKPNLINDDHSDEV